MGMQITYCSSVEETRERAAEALRSFLNNAKNRQQPLLLLLSGGSAFSFLEHVPQELFGPHVTVGMLDERFNVGENISNFAQFKETPFYAAVRAAGASCIDTRAKDKETIEDFGDRFEQALRSWVEAHRNGVVVATMGIGVDGHTAGIMPFPENLALLQELFEDEQRWVVGYNAGNKNLYPLRVTVAFPFLRARVDHAVVYVVGEEKRNAFKKMAAERGILSETPARVIREMKDIQLFTDIS